MPQGAHLVEKTHLGSFEPGTLGSFLPELIPAAKFVGVAAAWTGLDFVAHQLFSVTAGPATPPGYYGNKLLYGIPALIIGRVFSDFVVGGPDVVRALTIATTANGLLQLRYAGVFGSALPADFNLAVFLIHEAILFPLAFLITGKPDVSLEKEAGYEVVTRRA